MGKVEVKAITWVKKVYSSGAFMQMSLTEVE